MKEEEPFAQEIQEENLLVEKKKEPTLYSLKCKMITALIIVIILFIILVIICFFINEEGNEEKKKIEDDYYAKITCIYNVLNHSELLPIFSPDFSDKELEKFVIYINDTKLEKNNKSVNVSSNGIVKIVSGNNVIKSYTAPKNIGYLYYTSPNADSTYQFSIDSSSGNTNPGQGQGQMPGQGMPGFNGTMPGMPGFNGSMPGMPPDQGQGMPGFNGTMPGMPGSNNNGTIPGIPPDQGQTNNGTNPGQNPGSNGEEQPTQGQGNATKDDDTYDVYTTADGTFMKYNSIYLIMAVFTFLTL